MHFELVSDTDSIMIVRIIDPLHETILKNLIMNYARWPVTINVELEKEEHGRVGIIASPKSSGDNHTITPSSPTQLGFSGVDDVLTGLSVMQIAFPAGLYKLLVEKEASIKSLSPGIPRPSRLSLSP